MYVAFRYSENAQEDGEVYAQKIQPSTIWEVF